MTPPVQSYVTAAATVDHAAGAALRAAYADVITPSSSRGRRRRRRPCAMVSDLR
ncbi:hypothetical protein AB0D57_27810 [Streptomyces sp. NPDC048275]|uniref:hypothetical protein n=1 Tax=Streptomyces sp. NPDC048275 TaxID=3155629 RepID=UPI0033D9D1C6